MTSWDLFSISSAWCVGWSGNFLVQSELASSTHKTMCSYSLTYRTATGNSIGSRETILLLAIPPQKSHVRQGYLAMETNVNWFPFPHQNPLELNLTHFGRFSGPNVQCQHNRFHAFTIPTLMNSIVIHITLQPSIWWGHTQLSKPAANCHVSNCPNALAPRCEAVIYQGRALKNMRHQGLWQCPEIRLHQNGSRCMLSLSLSL